MADVANQMPDAGHSNCLPVLIRPSLSAWWVGLPDGRRRLEGCKSAPLPIQPRLSRQATRHEWAGCWAQSTVYGNSIEDTIRRIVREEIEAGRSPLVQELLDEIEHYLRAKDDRLMTVQQVAEQLQVEQDTIYRWIKDNKLASVTVGRARRIRRSAMDDFLEHQEHGDSTTPKVEKAAADVLRKLAGAGKVG